MMQLNRGFHAMRGGSAYGRGHMGVNPSFPLGYVRGDANAAWEVMSDEGRGTGLKRREEKTLTHFPYTSYTPLITATANT